MKKQLLILSACALYAGALHGQTTEDAIKNIRTLYAETEAKIASCQKVTMTDWVDEEEYAGYTPETVGYYDQAAKQFIKVTEEGGGDWHEETHSYYLKDGTLFFIFSKGYFPGEMYTAKELGISENELFESGGEAKTLSAFEDRIYISKGKIIQYLTKKKEFPGETSAFKMSGVKNDTGDLQEFDTQKLISHIEKVVKELNRKRLSGTEER